MAYYAPYFSYFPPVPVHRVPPKPKPELRVQIEEAKPLNLTWGTKYPPARAEISNEKSPPEEEAFNARSPDTTGDESMSSTSESQLSPTSSSMLNNSKDDRDPLYRLKRAKNNLSARKSREKAKRKIEEISKKNVIYEREIMELHAELNQMKDKCEEISKELDRKNRILQQITDWTILKEPEKCEPARTIRRNQMLM